MLRITVKKKLFVCLVIFIIMMLTVYQYCENNPERCIYHGQEIPHISLTITHLKANQSKQLSSHFKWIPTEQPTTTQIDTLKDLLKKDNRTQISGEDKQLMRMERVDFDEVRKEEEEREESIGAENIAEDGISLSLKEIDEREAKDEPDSLLHKKRGLLPASRNLYQEDEKGRYERVDRTILDPGSMTSKDLQEYFNKTFNSSSVFMYSLTDLNNTKKWSADVLGLNSTDNFTSALPKNLKHVKYGTYSSKDNIIKPLSGIDGSLKEIDNTLNKTDHDEGVIEDVSAKNQLIDSERSVSKVQEGNVTNAGKENKTGTYEINKRSRVALQLHPKKFEEDFANAKGLNVSHASDTIFKEVLPVHEDDDAEKSSGDYIKYMGSIHKNTSQKSDSQDATIEELDSVDSYEEAASGDNTDAAIITKENTLREGSNGVTIEARRSADEGDLEEEGVEAEHSDKKDVPGDLKESNGHMGSESSSNEDPSSGDDGSANIMSSARPTEAKENGDVEERNLEYDSTLKSGEISDINIANKSLTRENHEDEESAIYHEFKDSSTKNRNDSKTSENEDDVESGSTASEESSSSQNEDGIAAGMTNREVTAQSKETNEESSSGQSEDEIGTKMNNRKVTAQSNERETVASNAVNYKSSNDSKPWFEAQRYVTKARVDDQDLMKTNQSLRLGIKTEQITRLPHNRNLYRVEKSSTNFTNYTSHVGRNSSIYDDNGPLFRNKTLDDKQAKTSVVATDNQRERSANQTKEGVGLRSVQERASYEPVAINFEFVKKKLPKFTGRRGLRKSSRSARKTKRKTRSKENGLMFFKQFSCNPLSPKVLLYNRIFKTGSTSFNSYVAENGKLNNFKVRVGSTEDWYKTGNAYPFPSEIEHFAKKSSKKSFFSAHFFFRDNLDIRKSHTYINQVREPVDRIISHYYYMRQLKNRPKRRITEMIASGQLNETLEECIAKQHRGCESNVMTHFFCGVAPYCSSGSAKAIETAKYNMLHYYAAIGLLDRMDEYLDILRLRLPRFFPSSKRVLQREKENTNKTFHSQISQKTLEKLKTANQADYVLYEYAQVLFEKQLKACRAKLLKKRG